MNDIGRSSGPHGDEYGFYSKHQAKPLESTKHGSDMSSFGFFEVHLSCHWGWMVEGARKKAKGYGGFPEGHLNLEKEQTQNT